MTRARHEAVAIDGADPCRRAAQVLDWLQRHPESPRDAIRRKLGCSAETCQRTLAAMIGAGLVEVARVERGVQLWRCKQ